MLTKFDYTNAETSVTYNLNNDVAPFTDLDITVEQRVDTSRNKMEQHGVWPTFPYRGGMEIHIEGDLLADDSSDYVTKRLALVAALFGNASQTAPTVRKNGTVALRLSGQTEDFGCDVTITAFSGPITGSYNAYSKYLLSLFNPNPYFVGLTSGNKFYWS